jgi:hypothetical protein
MQKFIIILLLLLPKTGFCQTDTRRYVIEVAGAKVGTMTATRQPQGELTTYTLISDVVVNLLVYKVKIYYKTVVQYRGNKLLSAVVESRTNRGNYRSSTVWKDNQYEINASQYGHELHTVHSTDIDYSVVNLYFSIPVGRDRVFAEYFGDYFYLTKTLRGTYLARRDGREDEYVYETGKLTRIIKKNALKNFVIRLQE